MDCVPFTNNFIKAQINIAEVYLQQAIEAGGNQFVSCSEYSDSSAEQVNLETALTHIQHQELDALQNQVPGLIKRVMPLLDYLAKQVDDEAQTLIEALKYKFKN